MDHQQHHPEHHKKDTIKINLFHIIAGVLLIALLASILTSGFRFSSSSSQLSEKAAGEKTALFINQNVPGASASVVATEKVSGVYKITLSVNGQEGDSYLSQDGKLLFPAALPLDQPLNLPNTLDSAQPGQPSLPQQPIGVSAASGAVIGNANAAVTIIEFSDFQCPFCEKFFTETYPQLKKEYIDTGKAKLVYRHFPLSIHENAESAALAAECSKEQNKFWEYHDKLFQNQQSLDIASLKKYATDLKLETKQFNDCLDNKKYQSIVQQDLQDGAAVGVSGTPTFFVNGIPMVGAQPFSSFKQVIDGELNQ